MFWKLLLSYLGLGKPDFPDIISLLYHQRIMGEGMHLNIYSIFYGEELTKSWSGLREADFNMVREEFPKE